MACWRFDLRRKFIPALEGELSPEEAKRLEKHLLGCRRCRDFFFRIRAGHRSAEVIRPPDRGRDLRPEVFEEIQTEMRKNTARPFRWARESWLCALATPRMVQALVGLVFILTVLLVFSNRKALFGEQSPEQMNLIAIDARDFPLLRIPEIGANTRPRIAAEGYVRDVRIDREEGTLHFKLTEAPRGAGPFVVCEILSPFGIARPLEGSRVRVYGVARYDAQPGREWHEVNPVLNIDVLKN